jgi:hypothetical protein
MAANTYVGPGLAWVAVKIHLHRSCVLLNLQPMSYIDHSSENLALCTWYHEVC